MITEKVTEIYELEFSKRKPGARFLDGQFSIYKKYFATRDEARTYRKENCREGDGSITKLYAVLEDDGKWSAFAKDAEITSSAEDPDAKCNWIQNYHYFLARKWAESFRKYPGNLIAVTMCATSSGNEFVITPADYDEKIDNFIYVDNDSNIFFTRDLKLKVTLEKSDLNQAKAVQHPAKSLKALKPSEASVSSSTTPPKYSHQKNSNNAVTMSHTHHSASKGKVKEERSVADIEAEMRVLLEKREKGEGGKALDFELIDLINERDKLLAKIEYPKPRPSVRV